MKPMGMGTDWGKGGRAIATTAIAWGLLTVLAVAQAVPYNPPNRGAPGRSGTVRDAGSRGCGLIVLEPTQTHWGETLQPQPTFWVFVSEADRTLQLTLTHEATNEVLYTTTYGEMMPPGIRRLVAPADAPALEYDQPYRWKISIDCPDEGATDPSTTGIVMRRSPTAELTQQLAVATPEERIALLAGHGLWYDALTELGDLRLSDPTSKTLLESWASLLEHDLVQLDDVVDQPLIPSCPARHPDPTIESRLPSTFAV